MKIRGSIHWVNDSAELPHLLKDPTPTQECPNIFCQKFMLRDFFFFENMCEVTLKLIFVSTKCQFAAFLYRSLLLAFNSINAMSSFPFEDNNRALLEIKFPTILFSMMGL